jgi:hypothetical protein
MQERCLHVHAEHDAEPNQGSIGANHGCQQLLRDRRYHRQDDESDLEEVEKERDKEDEQVDEDQKSPHATWQGCQEVLEPNTAIAAEKQVDPIRMKVTMQVIRMVVW